MIPPVLRQRDIAKPLRDIERVGMRNHSAAGNVIGFDPEGVAHPAREAGEIVTRRRVADVGAVDVDRVAGDADVVGRGRP